MATKLKLTDFVNGTIAESDMPNIKRLVMGLHTGIDPATKGSVTDTILADARFKGRTVDGGRFPLVPNVDPNTMRGPDGKYRDHRYIAVRTAASAARIGPFYAPKGKGFASVLDPFKQIIGIVADSDAGKNTVNTEAHAAKLANRAPDDGTPKRRGRKPVNKQAEILPESAPLDIDDDAESTDTNE